MRSASCRSSASALCLRHTSLLRTTAGGSSRALICDQKGWSATRRLLTPSTLTSATASRGFKTRAIPHKQALPRRAAEEQPPTSQGGSTGTGGGGGGGASNSAGGQLPPHPSARPPQAPITWKSALLALGACGVVLGYFEFEKAKRKPRIEIAVAGTPSIGGPFTLVDQNGHVVTNHSFRGRYMLVYFGFTFCPDICPAELAKVTKTLKILEEEEGITPGLVVPVFISVDPYRDTVVKIRNYLKDFHPSFVGLTGTPQQVESMARSFRVYSSTSQHSEEDEDYLVDHSIFLYLMDKEGGFLSHHGSQYDAQALAKRIADDVRAKGDCPPSLWAQVKEKASTFVSTFIH